MRTHLAWTMAAALLAFGDARAGTAPAAEISSILRDYAVYDRFADPIRAGQRDDAASLRIWAHDSAADIVKRKTMLETLQTRLAKLDSSKLAGEDALSATLLRQRVDAALETIAFHEEWMPFADGEGFYTTPEETAAVTAIRGTADAEAWLARLRAVPAFYAMQEGNMRLGMAAGFTQPAQVVRKAIAAVTALANEPAGQSALLIAFANLPQSIDAASQAQLRKQAEVIIAQDIRPAQRELARFFLADYLPKARPMLAARSLPSGNAYYAHAVRFHTTTDMTPDEVHALGEREVARIRHQMDALIARTGFKGSFREFLDFLHSDKRFYASDPQNFVEKASEIAKRIDGQLPHFFGTLPRLTYTLRIKPKGLETISSGYWPGSPEQGVAGAIIITPSDYNVTSIPNLVPWVLHEGEPGHHLQIALAQERRDLPEFRRNDDITAFVEGWGLYSESLGNDMKIYRDDYERFGQLSWEMWRACRLVMDTGIHWLGWSRDQAEQCLKENTVLDPKFIDKETDRYIGWPGQALAYKIGELEIHRLRAMAQERLGAHFDLRAFHDAVLDEGPMPMTVLNRRITAWIDQQEQMVH